jgi:hypothetical protein
MRLEEGVMPGDGPPGGALAWRHRRCASALAEFRLLVAEVDPTIPRADAVAETDRLVGRVLDELRAADTTVLAALAGSNRGRPAARLLAVRLDRLMRAAVHVDAAVRAGNVPLLHRTMIRFDALARAACAVQLDAYASATAAGDGRWRLPPAGRRALPAAGPGRSAAPLRRA